MLAERTSHTLWVVACALLDADGRVLITQRPEGKENGGKWEFPGGKVEIDESPERALQRELREELMVEPCVECFEPLGFATGPWRERTISLLLYACRRWDGFVRPTEGQAVRWLPPGEVTTLDLGPLDRYLAEVHAERITGRRVF